MASVAQLSVQSLLSTETVSIRDVICLGECQGRDVEEHSTYSFLVFPYRGVYVRHLGNDDTVAEANQVLFFNEAEGYRVSHPIAGGDASMVLAVSEPLLRELLPVEHLRGDGVLGFKRQRLGIDPLCQALAALLRFSLSRKTIETLEAETLALTLVRRAVGERTSHVPQGSMGRQKLVDYAKLVLSSDLARRWTLAEIAAEVRASPVYLTQVFQQVEATPLYRYQLRLRLARALTLLGHYDDLTSLGLYLGFSSHSHFTAAFRQAYGRTPTEFRQSIGPR